jgi:PKD repeat protein
MKKGTLAMIAVLAVSACLLYSCKKVPAPTAEIFATVEGYQVTFNPQVADADTYSWDFGDGTAGSAELNPVHVYESFGDYTVTLVVTGEGGDFTATKVISIAATSIRDLLTGGSKAANGKTWVFDKAYSVGDGGGPVQNAPYNILIPSTDNVLALFGLGDEYDNEYTFFFDGRYSMNPKNGNVLAGAVFGYATGTISGEPAWDIGLCAASFTPPASAVWSLNTDNFTVDAIGDPNDLTVPPVHGIVTFSGQNWLSFSEGAYFGILDFPSTARCIIDEITPNKMKVSLFVCGYGFDGGDPSYNMMPTNMFHLTFITK